MRAIEVVRVFKCSINQNVTFQLCRLSFSAIGLKAHNGGYARFFANVIRKWLPLYRDQPPATLPVFVPLRATLKRQAEGSAIIELPFGDMRAGTETALARVIAVFGAAKPHCAYPFANHRATRMKVLVNDGFGVWLAARRLNQGKFHWPSIRQGCEIELDTEQLLALVLSLPRPGRERNFSLMHLVAG